MIDLVLVNKEQLASRAIQLMAHILLVHQSWNNRMPGKAGLPDVWQPVALEEIDGADSQNMSSSLEIINSFELEKRFNYRNSKGVEFTNTYRDVLFHLINHSNYHRGQINVHLRTAGVEPVITDYVFYKR